MEQTSKLDSIIYELNKGNNVLLSGPGGSGKTWTLGAIVENLGGSKKISCCATTGIAAVGMNMSKKVRTLHSWAGVGMAQKSKSKLLGEVMTNENAVKRWKTTEILLVDEVSMLGKKLFNKLDYIGKLIRNCDLPFGGIQLLFSGDFLQLPPVKDDWVFESDVWDESNFISFVFDEPKRYNDLPYYEMLLRIRNGERKDEDMRKLMARARAYIKYQEVIKGKDENVIIKPTILYPKRIEVDTHNFIEMEKLKEPQFEYNFRDSFEIKNLQVSRDYYTKLLDDIIPKTLSLKKGCQVMLKYNLDVENGLINGSRGVVVGTYNDCCAVKFLGGKCVNITPHSWSVEDKNGSATRSQLPLILAWSLTVHKCQGSTLDYVVCDLGPSVFAPGQAYVALSRVRNLKSLFISNFHVGSIMADQKALEYCETL